MWLLYVSIHSRRAINVALPKRMLVRENQGKWILGRMLDRYMPRELIERPKVGLAVALGQWLRGSLRAWAQHLLDPLRLKVQGQLDAGKITVVGAKPERHLDRSYYLWNVIAFRAWVADNRGLEGDIGR
jgi:asparagine synthase (glutamine-hydrolysing)